MQQLNDIAVVAVAVLNLVFFFRHAGGFIALPDATMIKDTKRTQTNVEAVHVHDDIHEPFLAERVGLPCQVLVHAVRFTAGQLAVEDVECRVLGEPKHVAHRCFTHVMKVRIPCCIGNI